MIKFFIKISFVVLAFSNYCYSQNINSLREYYKNNILSLDPLEGIYDVEFSKQGENAFMVFPPQKERFKLMIKKNLNGDLKVINYGIGSTYDWKIDKIGDTNVYNFTHTWNNVAPTTYRVYLENGIQFVHEYEIPQDQMRYDMGRNYQAGFKVIIRWNFIKEYPTNRMYKEAKRKNEEVINNIACDWTGTGFALNNGYVVTNYHVIKNAKTIKIQGINGTDIKYNASVIATDIIYDLAVLKICDSRFSGFGAIPYRIKTTVSDVGEDVFVLGYPLTASMGNEIKLTTGIISSKSGFQGDSSLYQISAPVQQGNSGGPCFDKNGNLIGIVTAKHVGTENVSYVTKALYLSILLSNSSLSNITPSNNIISKMTLSNKVKKIDNFVFLITCWNSYQPTN